METGTTTPSPPSPGRVSRWAFAGVIAVVAAAGLGAGILIAADDDDVVGAPDTASQAAAVRVACERWLDADTTQPGTAGWCGGMAEWMTQRLRRDGVGAEMMWGDPQRMSDACRQWMGERPPDGTDVDAGSWCGSMVGWMRDHMVDWSGRAHWDDWMMQGMSRRGH